LDRLEVYVRDLGYRYDVFNAVRGVEDENYLVIDNIVLIVARLKALSAFLQTDDGANLAAAYKRAANILKAEEKKENVGRASARQDDTGSRRAEARPTVDEKLLAQPEEKALYAALKNAESKAETAISEENFEAAMSALSQLRAPLDAFFEKVTVNADDPELRMNRLALLARFRAATGKVADFSKLEG
jgi:glycyl-tRNA synthetase beta chain